MGVLRVDEVCAVGVAGVELRVVDGREDLPRGGTERLWCCAHCDLQFSRIVGQSSAARVIAAAIAWLTVVKGCTVGSRFPCVEVYSCSWCSSILCALSQSRIAVQRPFNLRLEHDRVADRWALGPAIADADIGIEIDEDLPRPRSIGAHRWMPIEFMDSTLPTAWDGTVDRGPASPPQPPDLLGVCPKTWRAYADVRIMRTCLWGLALGVVMAG